MIELPEDAPMARYQQYIHELETLHGWLDVDLVHNCFLMGEEVGELFKAIRRLNRLWQESAKPDVTDAQAKAAVGEEIVDVLNYLLAIANRLDIDVESTFRVKNARNQRRSWSS